MNCEAYTELISGALDGVLTPEEQAMLDTHLEQCPQCRTLMTELSALDLALNACNEEVPEGFSDRVMDRIRTEGPAPAHRKNQGADRWRRLLPMAALFALVVVGATRLPWGGTDGTGPESNAGWNSAAVLNSPEVAQQYGAEMANDKSGDDRNEINPKMNTQMPMATPLSQEEALEQVAALVSDDSGYECRLVYQEDRCEIQRYDGGELMDQSMVVYQGLSGNGLYYLFAWTWEGQTEEEKELFLYAVPLEGDEILWRGASAPDFSAFDEVIQS